MADPVLSYIPGVWDLLHVGHLNILRMAKSLGDKLIVGVPSDYVVLMDKGTPPVIPLWDRMEMLRAVRYVDAVVDYHTLDFMDHLHRFKPDIFIIGDSWGHEDRHVKAEKWVVDNGKRLIRLARYPGESTTAIKNRIRSNHERDRSAE